MPVVAGDNSSIKEIVGIRRGAASRRLDGSALLVDPKNAEAIAEATYKIISDKNYRKELIAKGYENTKRFNWDRCAEEISRILKT